MRFFVIYWTAWHEKRERRSVLKVDWTQRTQKGAMKAPFGIWGRWQISLPSQHQPLAGTSFLSTSVSFVRVTSLHSLRVAETDCSMSIAEPWHIFSHAHLSLMQVELTVFQLALAKEVVTTSQLRRLQSSFHRFLGEVSLGVCFSMSCHQFAQVPNYGAVDRLVLLASRYHLLLCMLLASWVKQLLL